MSLNSMTAEDVESWDFSIKALTSLNNDALEKDTAAECGCIACGCAPGDIVVIEQSSVAFPLSEP